jgi:hypothetical protein
VNVFCSWLQITLLAGFISSVLCAPAASAQTCEDDNPPHAVTLLQRLQSYCENYDVPYSFDLYALAAVAGKIGGQKTKTRLSSCKSRSQHLNFEWRLATQRSFRPRISLFLRASVAEVM